MWRYKLVPIIPPGQGETQIAALEAMLNELGGLGWEAIGVMPQTEGGYVLFKMPYETGTY